MSLTPLLEDSLEVDDHEAHGEVIFNIIIYKVIKIEEKYATFTGQLRKIVRGINPRDRELLQRYGEALAELYTEPAILRQATITNPNLFDTLWYRAKALETHILSYKGELLPQMPTGMRDIDQIGL